MTSPAMPRPTPREERRLDDACASDVLAGVREVESLEALIILAMIDRTEADLTPTEADLARAWTAADPPADPSGEDRP